MATTQPELRPRESAVSVSTSATRALVRELGATAWAVLLDVSLDAYSAGDGRTARTSVRVIADHLGLAPGTVARALARLTTAGLVERRDRRDSVTGRFVESVYIVSSMSGMVPCVDCPHTAEPHTAAWPAPATNRNHDGAGQRLPEGMASVCRPFSRGVRLGRGAQPGLATQEPGTEEPRGDGRLGLFDQESRSC